MAFGLKRPELLQWKQNVKEGKIAILTYYWRDERFPGCTTVTKIGCNHIDKLLDWGQRYQLPAKWLHYGEYPHFDVFGDKQIQILVGEGMTDQLERFQIGR